MLSLGLLTIGLCDVFRKEQGFLRAYKLYLDLHGHDDIRIKNLNGILLERLLENENLKILFTNETTISFSHGLLLRKTLTDLFRINGVAKVEDSVERMQKKYQYTVNFLDLTMGSFGQITAECVYNHDEDFYFKKIVVYVRKPFDESFIILDSENMIDI